MSVEREVIIKIRTEILEAEGTPPDLKPLIDAQKEAKASTEEATEAIKEQCKALEESQEAHRHVAESAHEVAAAHEGHGASLMSLTRPLTMVIHSAMHLAHSWALLTASSKENAEEMTRSLMKYEGWIMGASGVLHLLHGIGHAYEHVSKMAEAAVNTAAAATAEAHAVAMENEARAAMRAQLAIYGLVDAELVEIAVTTSATAALWANIVAVGLFLAPVIAVAAAITLVVGVMALVVDSFDGFGRHAAKAAEEARHFAKYMGEARSAALEFHMAEANAHLEANEKKMALREKADPNRHPLMSGHRDQELKKEMDFIRDEKDAMSDRYAAVQKIHALEKQTQDEERKKDTGSFWEWDSGSESSKKGRKDKYDKKDQELEARHAKELGEIGEAGAKLQEKEAEMGAKRVDNLVKQRDHLQQNLKTQQDIVKSAEKELAVAQQKERSANQHFGEMDEAKAAELERVSKKVDAGGWASLNRAEKTFVRSEGTEEHKAFAAEQTAIEGKASGREGKTTGLMRKDHQPGQDEKSAESKRSEGQKQAGIMAAALKKKEQDLLKYSDELSKSFDKMADTTVNVIAKLKDRVKAAERKIQLIKDSE